MADIPDFDSCQSIAASAATADTEAPKAEAGVDKDGVECPNDGDLRPQLVEAQFPVNISFSQRHHNDGVRFHASGTLAGLSFNSKVPASRLEQFVDRPKPPAVDAARSIHALPVDALQISQARQPPVDLSWLNVDSVATEEEFIRNAGADPELKKFFSSTCKPPTEYVNTRKVIQVYRKRISAGADEKTAKTATQDRINAILRKDGDFLWHHQNVAKHLPGLDVQLRDGVELISFNGKFMLWSLKELYRLAIDVLIDPANRDVTINRSAQVNLNSAWITLFRPKLEEVGLCTLKVTRGILDYLIKGHTITSRQEKKGIQNFSRKGKVDEAAQGVSLPKRTDANLPQLFLTAGAQSSSINRLHCAPSIHAPALTDPVQLMNYVQRMQQANATVLLMQQQVAYGAGLSFLPSAAAVGACGVAFSPAAPLPPFVANFNGTEDQKRRRTAQQQGGATKGVTTDMIGRIVEGLKEDIYEHTEQTVKKGIEDAKLHNSAETAKIREDLKMLQAKNNSNFRKTETPDQELPSDEAGAPFGNESKRDRIHEGTRNSTIPTVAFAREVENGENKNSNTNNSSDEDVVFSKSEAGLGSSPVRLLPEDSTDNCLGGEKEHLSKQEASHAIVHFARDSQPSFAFTASSPRIESTSFYWKDLAQNPIATGPVYENYNGAIEASRIDVVMQTRMKAISIFTLVSNTCFGDDDDPIRYKIKFSNIDSIKVVPGKENEFTVRELSGTVHHFGCNNAEDNHEWVATLNRYLNDQRQNLLKVVQKNLSSWERRTGSDPIRIFQTLHEILPPINNVCDGHDRFENARGILAEYSRLASNENGPNDFGPTLAKTLRQVRCCFHPDKQIGALFDSDQKEFATQLTYLLNRVAKKLSDNE